MKLEFSGNMHLRGCACHLSLYCVYNDWENKIYRVPIFQCLFLEAETRSLKTFLIRGQSLDQESLNEIEVTRKETMLWDLQEQSNMMDKKIAAISNLIMNNGELVRTLSKFFVPLTVVLGDDGLEILEAYVCGEELMLPLDTVPVILRCIGDYAALDTKHLLSNECTQASKKIRFGYSVMDFHFSLTVSDVKICFSHTDTGEAVCEKMKQIFSFSVCAFGGEQVLLVTPKNAYALLFDDDLCLLLLQSVFAFLHEKIFGVYKQVLVQLCEYIGPDLWPFGNERSVSFIGYPNLWLLSVSDLERRVPDTTYICREILSFCGLAPILGPRGRHAVPVVRELSIEMPGSETSLQRFRFNSQYVSSESLCFQTGPEDTHLFFSDSDMYVVTLPDCLRLLLKSTVPKAFLPCFDENATEIDLLLKFMSRLQHRSYALFDAVIFMLDAFVSAFQRACTLMGMRWLLVRDLHMFYLTCDGKDTHVVMPLLQTAVENCWEKTTEIKQRPTFQCAEISRCGFIVYARFFLSSGLSQSKEAHWTVTASKYLSACIRTNKTGLCFASITVYFQDMMCVFIANRYNVSYWIEEFDPNDYCLEYHEGLLDCSRYTAVMSEDGQLVRQARGIALTDKINFSYYILVTLRVLRRWVESKFEDVEQTQFIRWENRMLCEHIHLLHLN